MIDSQQQCRADQRERKKNSSVQTWRLTSQRGTTEPVQGSRKLPIHYYSTLPIKVSQQISLSTILFSLHRFNKKSSHGTGKFVTARGDPSSREQKSTHKAVAFVHDTSSGVPEFLVSPSLLLVASPKRLCGPPQAVVAAPSFGPARAPQYRLLDRRSS